MKAVILISHGSRISKTKEEVSQLIEKIRPRTTITFIQCAFLELESPSIPEAIADCIKQGADEIIILLNFLNAGRHVDTDIPQIINEARHTFPHVKIYLTQPVGQHEGIANLFSQMLLPYTK